MKKSTLAVIVVILGLAGAGAYTHNNSNQEVQPTNSPLTSKTSIKPLVDVKEGVHYAVVNSPLNIPDFDGTVLTEFFWLGCPHCQDFEQHVVKWKVDLNKEMNAIVDKVAVPGTARWNTDAKVYFTMKEMGATPEQVTKMLSLYNREAEVNKRYPNNPSLGRFFAEVGLNSQEAMAIFLDGSSLQDDLQMATQEFAKSGARGVPTFVVNGKYRVLFDTVESDDDVYEIIRALSYKD